MAAASLGLPAQNPAFNLPDFPLVRLAGRTLAKAHLEHPEEADHSIEGVVPVREAAPNFIPEAVLKRDALVISPAKKQCSELFPAVLVALAAEWVLGEPAIALWNCDVGVT